MEPTRRAAWYLFLIEAALIALILVMGTKIVWGQSTVPIDHWELGIFQTATVPTEVSPFLGVVSLTQYPLSLVKCQLPKAFSADTDVYSSVVDGPDGIPANPTVVGFMDPNNALLECRATITAPVLALPIGTGYWAALRTVSATGSKSSWSHPSNPFRRAPRGQPCTMPNGQIGAQLSVDADINGRATHVVLCVQQ